MVETLATHKRVQFPRGTTAQNNGYIGLPAELTVDLQRRELRLHDGETLGGNRIVSLTALQSLFLSAESEAGKLDFAASEVGFLTRVSNEAYELRKFTAEDGLIIEYPDGIGDPEGDQIGNPNFRLPARLREVAYRTDGRRTPRDSGFYTLDSDANYLPPDVKGKAGASMLTFQVSDTACCQLLITREEVPRFFIGSQTAGTWNDWVTLTPLEGTFELLEQGVNRKQRTWSANDLDDWFRAKAKDLLDENTSNDPILYSSKILYREQKGWSGSPSPFVKGPVSLRTGDRFVVKCSADGRVFEGTFGASIGGNVVINLKVAGNWEKAISQRDPVTQLHNGDASQTSTDSILRVLYTPTNTYICDADWVTTKTLPGAWSGEFQFDTDAGTGQMNYSVARIRQKL